MVFFGAFISSSSGPMYEILMLMGRHFEKGSIIKIRVKNFMVNFLLDSDVRQMIKPFVIQPSPGFAASLL